jgi:hypothetical protein
MAKLTAAERDALPSSDFAIPEGRKYPIPDEEHARDALARVEADGTDSEKREVFTAVKTRYPAMNITATP